MGSKSDEKHIEKMEKVFNELEIPYHKQVCSAHRTPELLDTVVNTYCADDLNMCYIAVAGMSNALAGALQGATSRLVISSPRFDNLEGYMIDIHSSMRMPPGVVTPVFARPDNAALFAVQVLGQYNSSLLEKVRGYKTKFVNKIHEANKGYDFDNNKRFKI